MKCRHCLVDFHDNWEHLGTLEDVDGPMAIAHTKCPACRKMHIAYYRNRFFQKGGPFVYPRAIARAPVDPAVPKDFADDYVEACNVLDISPKASAALSRRVLQHILREKAGVKAPNLDQEIQLTIKGSLVPGHIADSLDAVRNIGNFAAHPMKSTSSGEVLPVEAGEAEWNLDTVEALFDFYFVQPERTKARRDALNMKLADAGKPPLK